MHKKDRKMIIEFDRVVIDDNGQQEKRHEKWDAYIIDCLKCLDRDNIPHFIYQISISSINKTIILNQLDNYVENIVPDSVFFYIQPEI